MERKVKGKVWEKVQNITGGIQEERKKTEETKNVVKLKIFETGACWSTLWSTEWSVRHWESEQVKTWGPLLKIQKGKTEWESCSEIRALRNSYISRASCRDVYRHVVSITAQLAVGEWRGLRTSLQVYSTHSQLLQHGHGRHALSTRRAATRSWIWIQVGIGKTMRKRRWMVVRGPRAGVVGGEAWPVIGRVGGQWWSWVGLTQRRVGGELQWLKQWKKVAVWWRWLPCMTQCCESHAICFRGGKK